MEFTLGLGLGVLIAALVFWWFERWLLAEHEAYRARLTLREQWLGNVLSENGYLSMELRQLQAQPMPDAELERIARAMYAQGLSRHLIEVILFGYRGGRAYDKVKAYLAQEEKAG